MIAWLTRLFHRTPCRSAFRRAESQRGDCSNKAGYYMRALDKAGYEPLAHLTRVFRTAHVVVEVNGWYYDPAWGGCA